LKDRTGGNKEAALDVCVAYPNEQLVLIDGKIRRGTSIANAYWHRLD